MKKPLLPLLLILGLFSFALNVSAQRYVSEIFTSVTVTPNIVYGENIQFLTGAADTIDLKADVYQPVGDTMTLRPTVILIHTGSFLPIFYNGQATGIKTDSVVTELCRQYARRGYTAIAMDYRLGWNPQALGSAGQDVRTGTLLQSVYRAMQDAKACVRYFRNDALNANTYGIDESKIILQGMGSGGYIAMAYPSLTDPAQISLPKFLAATTNATYGFTAGMSYINQAIWGDFDGYGGAPGYNIATNTPGVANDIAFVINCAGALGDSSWLQGGTNVPFVAFHSINDPFAPYKDGSVIVPTTGDFSYAGGNPTRFIAKWDGVSWSDVGLGVDSMVASFCVFNHALYVGGFFLNAGGNNANHIAKWLSLAGIDDTSELSEIDLFPNPTNSFLHIKNPKLNNSKLHLYNLVGDCVLFLDNLNPEEQVIDISFLSNGIYFAKITIKERTTIRKISLIK